MYHRKLDKDIRCPLDYGMSVFGGKWKVRIICVLSGKSCMRYSEILKNLGNVTDAVLSSSLKELVSDGIIGRVQYEEIPPRVEYSLTERGQSVLPILKSIAEWAGACQREDNPDNINSMRCVKCDYKGGK